VPAARRFALLLTGAALATGCATAIQPAKTQLEVRAFQTYAFDTSDSRLVMKAMFNALQDDGYVVKNAVIELGLITATREIDLAPGRSNSTGGETVSIVGRLAVIASPPPAYSKIEVHDFTGNVTPFGEHTKVRISFQRKVLDSRGHVVEVNPIDDPAFYQDFFSRMDKSVYLQQERL
jgi:hypothetical protein